MFDAVCFIFYAMNRIKLVKVFAMNVDYRTDTGKRRDHNEDSIMVDNKRGIFLLADGMGGHQAGEVASRMAVEVAYDYLAAMIKPGCSRVEIFKHLTSALSKADHSIKISTKDNFSLMGMGTTLVMTVIIKNRAYICHTGDSRAYLIRKDIKQITKDQTWGNYLVEQKKTPREKIPRQSWHILTQAVGVTNKITPELKEVKLEQEDILLLCSDGLTDMLKDNEVEKIIRKYKDNHFNKTAFVLVEAANYRGGRDNISVVVVKYKPLKAELECTACHGKPKIQSSKSQISP